MAFEELLKRINCINEQVSFPDAAGKDTHGGANPTEPYFLLATSIEVYNDEVYDLLSDRTECTLR